MRCVRRAGFTLIELLVVISLLGILLGLLLPAVQKVRAVAVRIQCANNLKQIGLALHQYHDASGTLPAGVTSRRRTEPLPRMSWLTRLLPYVEQEPLWRYTLAAYDYSRRPYRNPPHLGLATPIALYSCPLDSRAQTPQPTHRNYVVALTSYVGVLGTEFSKADGVLFRDGRVRLTDVVDGTTSTLMVGERPPSADCWYGWWYAGQGQRDSGSGDMLLGVRERNIGARYASGCPAGPYHFVPGNITEQCDLFHFWSLHPGGAHFLYADGSVHFLRYDADAIMPALATRAGGEVVTVPY